MTYDILFYRLCFVLLYSEYRDYLLGNLGWKMLGRNPCVSSSQKLNPFPTQNSSAHATVRETVVLIIISLKIIKIEVADR